MIKLDVIGSNILKIVTPARLSVDDFEQLGPKVDPIIKQFGSVSLLIDASALEGWDDMAAFEKHAGFVKAHQQKVDRVAVIAPHEWQHWLVAAVRVFLHPRVRAYGESDANAALRWVEETRESVPTT
jgi:hypothetical protein